MECLKSLMALLVAFCAVLVTVSAELIPAGKLPVPPLPPLGSETLCSDIQKYFCCDGPEIEVIETVKRSICADVLNDTCPVVADDICSENKTISLLLKIPDIFLSKVKNVICCGDKSVELINCIKETICSKVVTVLCCKGVNVTDLDSAKKELCPNPCDEMPCENNGTCTYTKEEGKICHCVYPFSGVNCEKDPCDELPCKNGGTCSFDKEKKEIICDCLDTNFGDRCEFNCCNFGADYEWTNVDFPSKVKPDNIVSGCDNGDEPCDVYPARVKTDEGYVLGKLIAKQNHLACYIPNGKGGEKSNKEDCQVLKKRDGMEWDKAVIGKDHLDCAIVGVPKEQDVYYVGRGMSQSNGVSFTGGVGNGTFRGTYVGKEYKYTAADGFDFLVCKEET